MTPGSMTLGPLTPGLGSYAFRWSIGHRDRVPPQPMTALAVLEAAHAAGLGVVQYADNLPLHRLSDGELDTLAAVARDRGMALEVGTQAFEAETIRRYLAIARRLGAGILRIALDAEDAATPLGDLAAGFRALLLEARDAGCRIAIENHFDFPSRRLVELLDRVPDPALGVCLDVANSICAGEWPMETVGLLAPRTINLHLKDYVIRPDPYGVGFRILGCPLGEGRTDIDAVLDALEGRPMSVILEHWLPWPGDFATATGQEHDWVARSAGRLHEVLAAGCPS